MWLICGCSGHGQTEESKRTQNQPVSAHQKGLAFIYSQDTEMLARIFKIAKNATLLVRAVDGCGSVVRAAEQNSHKI